MLQSVYRDVSKGAVEVTGCACGPDVTMGGYENQEMVPIPPHMDDYRKARVAAGLSPSVCIDRCILAELEELWALGVRTYGSCCGHNLQPSMVNVHPSDAEVMWALGYARYVVTDCDPNMFNLKTAGHHV